MKGFPTKQDTRRPTRWFAFLNLPDTICAMTGPSMRRRHSLIPDAGARVEQARTRLGLSRRELAEGAGISERAITGWERQGKSPNAKQLGAVARYLEEQHGYDLHTEQRVARGASVDENIIYKIRHGHALSAAEAERVIGAIEQANEETND